MSGEKEFRHNLTKLGSNNYDAWSYKMRNLLVKEGLWKAISGISPEEVDENYNDWKHIDEKALATIALNIEDSQIVHVKPAKTAKEAWNTLEDFYKSSSLMTQIRLIAKISNTKVEDKDIKEHLTNLMGMFDELAELEMPMSDNMKVGFIFGSLNEDYDTAITAMSAWNKERLNPKEVRYMLVEEYEKIKKKTGYRHKMEDLRTKLETQRSKQEEPRVKSEVHVVPPARATTTYQSTDGWLCHECRKLGHFRKDCEIWKKKLEEMKKNKVFENYSAMFVTQHEKRKLWIIDSGATTHMCNDITQFTRLEEYFSGINTANGSIIYSKGIGSVKLDVKKGTTNESLQLKQVLFVPDLNVNVVSVKQLLEKEQEIQFFGNGCYILDEGKLWKIADWNGKLYQMKETTILENLTTEIKTKLCIHDWHRKLAHRNLEDIRKQKDLEIAPCICDDTCESCIKGKLSRKSFPKKATPVNEPLDVIVSDVCGPLQTQTSGGKKYFVTFTDIFSGYTEIRLLREKREVAGKTINFIEYLKTQTGRKPKIFRSDKGTEYINKTLQNYLEKEGIKFECTVGYAPEQNGVSERKNRTLMEAARTMLEESKSPKRLWGEAVHAANFVFNRLTNKETNKTPYETLFGKQHSKLEFHEFGSSAYAMIPYEKRRKLDNKAVEATFVGYDENSKGYRLIDKNNKLIISREVKFVQNKTKHRKISRKFKRKIQTTIQKQNESPEDDDNVSLFCDNDFQEENRNMQENNNEIEEENSAVQEENEDSEDSFHDAQEENQSQEESDSTEVSSESENEPIIPRRSTRHNIGKAPQRFNDYELYKVEMEDDFFEPKTYLEAITCKQGHLWKKAMEEEIQSLEKNHTWEEIDLPKGKTTVGSKWVFKIKDDGDDIRMKARLVAQGFSQKYGVNYDEVFAPVVKTTTLRLLLSIAGKRKYHVRQYDVKTAFLNGKLEEEVYMRRPPGYGNEKKVLKLEKSIYGLKQAAKVWNDTLNNVLIKNDFKRNEHDKCLYTLQWKNETIHLLVHVDDLLVTGSSEDDIIKIMKNVGREFELKDLGNIKHYLGIDVEQDSEGNYLISQGKYIDKIVETANLEDSKISVYPMDVGYYKLEGELLDTNEFYRKLIGMLLFLSTHSRPDISACVGILSKKVLNPRDVDLLEAKRIIKYLKGSRNLKLKLSDSGTLQELHAYSDANWAEDKTDRKSNSGYFCSINGGAISWCSRKQETVATSSAESELMALTETCKEMKWLRSMIKSLKEAVPEKMLIFTDSQSCISMIKNEKFSNKTKHIDIKYHYVRDLFTNKEVNLQYVNTEINTADLMTKPLAGTKTSTLRKLAGLVSDSGGVLNIESDT